MTKFMVIRYIGIKRKMMGTVCMNWSYLVCSTIQMSKKLPV